MGDDGGVRAAYDVVADAYADHLATVPAESEEELVALARFMDLVPRGGRILDAGAGPGRLCDLLAGRGHAVVALDLSEGMLGRARRDHPGVPLVVGDVTALPFATGAFAALVSWFSTIYLDDEGLCRAFAETRRVLHRDGVAAVAFQTGAGARDLAPVYRDLGHDVELSRVSRDPVDVADVAASCGLTLLERHDAPPRTPGADGRSVLLLQAQPRQ